MWQISNNNGSVWFNAPANSYWDMGRLVVSQSGRLPIRYSGGDVRWYTPKRSEEFATLIPPAARKHLRATYTEEHNANY